MQNALDCSGFAYGKMDCSCSHERDFYNCLPFKYDETSSMEVCSIRIKKKVVVKLNDISYSLILQPEIE